MSQIKQKFIAFNTSATGVNARVIPANFTPSNYTPAAVGTEGTDKVSSNLKGIDTALVNIPASSITTGQLAVARGGTGIDGSSAANGKLLIGNGTGYTLANVTGTTSQVVVTNGSGSITLSLPQSIATSSSPTFVTVTSSTSLALPNNGNTLSLQSSASLAASYSITFPTNVPSSSGQALVSNTSGVLSYSSFVSSVSGDIALTSFTLADNQSAAANVTGLAFANASVQSFTAQATVVKSSLYAQYTINGIQKGSSWVIDSAYVGDVTGVVFSITTAGQVQYTSTSTGASGTVKFRANVISV